MVKVTSPRSALAVSSVAVLLLSGCATGSADSADTPIVIGYAGGLTGLFEAYDGAGVAGAEFAIDDINAAGGVLGRELELITADTQSSIDQGARAAQELLAQDITAMLVSPDFNFGGPAATEANAAQVPVISVGAGSPNFGVQGIGPFAYTMGVSGVSDGAITAEWAFNEQDARTGYVLLDDTTDYDLDQCRGFTERWDALGGELVGSDIFKNSDTSISAQVTRITSLPAPPDVISLCSYTPGAAVAIKQIRDAGIDSLIVTNGSMDGNFWFADSMPDLSGLAFPSSASIWGNDPNDEVNDLVARYVEQNGQPQASYALYAYAAVQAIATAIERAESTDGQDIVDVLSAFDAEPLLFPVTFTPETHIDVNRPALIMLVENGEHSVNGPFTLVDVPELFAN